MDMDIGMDMARHSTSKDGFYSSPRSWILSRGHFLWIPELGVIVFGIHILRIPWIPIHLKNPGRTFTRWEKSLWSAISVFWVRGWPDREATATCSILA